MATMADVARHAGVSVATVSHVVNETRPVRDDTRRRVLESIRDTGYIQNTLARALAMSSTRSIGLSMSAISNPYFSAVVHALETGLSHSGYTLLLTDPHEDADRELRVVKALHERRVDAILMAPVPGSRENALAYLARHDVPTVLVDRLAWDRFDQVSGENEHATGKLVTHLAELGHRRIGFVSGLKGLSTTDERVRGYHVGLQHHDLARDPALVVSGGSATEAARIATHRLMELAVPPTAIIVANNLMTIGVMRGLRDRGVGVPRDIALVSFDDFEWADLFSPRLTTIAQAVDAMGAEAVHLLLTRIKDPGLPPRTVRLAPTFVHRDSCGCPEGMMAPDRAGAIPA